MADDPSTARAPNKGAVGAASGGQGDDSGGGGGGGLGGVSSSSSSSRAAAAAAAIFDADRVFALFDVDRNGSIDASDLKELMRELGLQAPLGRLISALLTFDEGALWWLLADE